MSNVADLLAAREAAGARYAAAVQELKSALVDLVAHERALCSSTVAHLVPEFGGDWPDPISLRHPTFAPDLGGRWSDDVTPRLEQILRTFTR